jgi:hypothetical protein
LRGASASRAERAPLFGGGRSDGRAGSGGGGGGLMSSLIRNK